MTGAGYAVARLDGIERIGAWIPVRAHFGIEAFGVNAWRRDEAGDEVIGDHDEASSGHEELYVVLGGHATFTVDGEEFDAPVGTLVFVRDPAVRRRAVAREAATTVLAIGGKRGEPFEVRDWEENREIIPLFERGEFAEAKRRLEAALERRPDAAGLLYNLACAESRLGNADAAIAALRRAVDLHERFREYARTDPDIEPIRDRPEIVELIGRRGQ